MKQSQLHRSELKVKLIALFLCNILVNAININTNAISWEAAGNIVTRYGEKNLWKSAGAMSPNGNVIVTTGEGLDGYPTVQVFQLNKEGAWAQLGNYITTSEKFYRFALSSDGHTFVMSNWGSVLVYKLSEGTSSWEQVGSTITGDTGTAGQAIDISNNGNVVAVGDPLYSNHCGKTDIYDWNGTQWKQRGDSIVGCWRNNSQAASNFQVLSLSGDGNKIALDDRIYHWVSSSASWEQLGSDFRGKSALQTALSNDGNVAVMAYLRYQNGDDVDIHLYRWDESTDDWKEFATSIRNTVVGPKYMLLALNGDGSRFVVSWPYLEDEGYSDGLVKAYQYNGLNQFQQLGQSFMGSSNDHMSMGEPLSIDIEGDTVFFGWSNFTAVPNQFFFQTYKLDSPRLKATQIDTALF